MKISEQGIEFIKKEEGVVLTAYQCEAGVWTIGYGHTAGVKKSQTITMEKAESLLRKDLKDFEMGVNSLLRERKVKIPQHSYDMLVSFAFNTGLVALRTSTLLKKLKEKDFEGAGNEFPRWIWVTQNGVKKQSAVLKGRREREQKIFLEGYTDNDK